MNRIVIHGLRPEYNRFMATKKKLPRCECVLKSEGDLYSYYERKKYRSVYVLSVKLAYVDKTRKNETTDLWHERLRH
ncbi:hypothetical protein J1N35_034883, partial [Gossypium stocksii]